MRLPYRRRNSRVALVLLAAMATPALAGPPGEDATPDGATGMAQIGTDGARASAPDDPAHATGTESAGVFGNVGRAISAGARSVGDWLGSVTEGGEGEETAAEAVPATDAEAPTLANALWIGFAPAVYTGGDPRPGAWIAGPFDREQRTGWIADTATGATTRVTLIWRAPAQVGAAALSEDAAKALGLREGDVANIAVYLPR